jgi:hypothetical protein
MPSHQQVPLQAQQQPPLVAVLQMQGRLPL